MGEGVFLCASAMRVCVSMAPVTKISRAACRTQRACLSRTKPGHPAIQWQWHGIPNQPGQTRNPELSSTGEKDAGDSKREVRTRNRRLLELLWATDDMRPRSPARHGDSKLFGLTCCVFLQSF